jgi:5-formyltetrahydrofolate cyclo-ligase
MDKKELRNYYLQLRLNLSEAAWAQGSQRMCDLFFIQVDLSFVKTIHIYLPLKKKSEPDTWLIIDRLKREFPNIQVAVPKINPATNLMKSVLFEGVQQLKQNEWGIDEPTSGKEISAQEVDLIVVPLLAFDRAGHRVGYGKGFYDKFLSHCREDAKKIGLSFFEPLALMPHEAHDLKLDAVITPTDLYSFES